MKAITSKDFVFDDNRRIVQVAGVNYDYTLFEELGMFGMEKGQKFRIMGREEDIVTIERLD